jgi:hypothetical protein
MMNLTRWLYRGGRPNWVAAILNRLWAAVHALGIAPNYLVTLEVRGRRSGRRISLPLVMVVTEGERYLVSMLGADWAQNLKAAGGNGVLSHGRREEVHLEEIAVDRRAPVLKAYLNRAPGARPHLPVDKDAPLSEFDRVSAQFNAEQVEGGPCYPDLHSVPEPVEAVMIVTHPDMAAIVVRECADLGIRHVWLHRSFGQGSVSEEAAAECERHNINCLIGGCPMMYCFISTRESPHFKPR